MGVGIIKIFKVLARTIPVKVVERRRRSIRCLREKVLTRNVLLMHRIFGQEDLYVTLADDVYAMITGLYDCAYSILFPFKCIFYYWGA